MSTQIRHDDVRTRIRWVDAARALCVLAVVVMHTTISLLVVVEHTQVDVVWRQIVDAMTPFRMPALSLLSGMLLSRRIRAGWGDRSARASVALSYWLYAVWLLAFLAVGVVLGYSLWLGPLGAGTALDGLRAFADQLVLPKTVLWYVVALAVWTAVLTALHRAQPAAVLIVLAVLSVTSFSLPGDGSDQYRNVIRYFVFFAVGVYFATTIRDRISARPWSSGAVALGVFAGTWMLTTIGSRDEVDNVLTVPRDISGAIIVMVLAVALTKIPGAGRLLTWVGRRTLPIYVMHALLLDLLTMYPGWWIHALDDEFVHTIAPIVITFGVAAVAVGFHTLVIRTPARVIFALPASWHRRILKERT